MGRYELASSAHQFEPMIPVDRTSDKESYSLDLRHLTPDDTLFDPNQFRDKSYQHTGNMYCWKDKFIRKKEITLIVHERYR